MFGNNYPVALAVLVVDNNNIFALIVLALRLRCDDDHFMAEPETKRHSLLTPKVKVSNTPLS